MIRSFSSCLSLRRVAGSSGPALFPQLCSAQFSRNTKAPKEMQVKYEVDYENIDFHNFFVGDQPKFQKVDKPLTRMDVERLQSYPALNLMEVYNHGFTQEELSDQPEDIKRIFRLSNYSDGDISKWRREMAVKRYQYDVLDRTSLPVQVALLTERLL